MRLGDMTAGRAKSTYIGLVHALPTFGFTFFAVDKLPSRAARTLAHSLRPTTAATMTSVAASGAATTTMATMSPTTSSTVSSNIGATTLGAVGEASSTSSVGGVASGTGGAGVAAVGVDNNGVGSGERGAVDADDDDNNSVVSTNLSAVVATSAMLEHGAADSDGGKLLLGISESRLQASGADNGAAPATYARDACAPRTVYRRDAQTRAARVSAHKVRARVLSLVD